MDYSKLLHSVHLNSANLALICLGINALICLLYLKKLDPPFRRLFYLLLLNLATEILAIVFTNWKINNLPLLHLYTLGEFILFFYFYESLISKPSLFRTKFWYFISVGSILIILNSLFFQSIYEFNNYAKTFVQITIISFAVLYFYNLIENQSQSPILSKSLRLINSAILIYYSGSLFIFMCSQFSFDDPKLYDIFWAFNSVLYFIFQLLIFWGLWKVLLKKTASSS